VNRACERIPHQLWEAFPEPGRHCFVGTGPQKRPVHRRQSLADGYNLVRRLSLAEDNFGMTLPEGAVMIDSCEGEIFEGKVPQTVERRLRGNAAGRYIGEQVFELLGGHATWATGSRYSRKIASASAIDSIWKSR
jgi:hypothetical protein